MRARDTSQEAHEFQLDGYRRMSLGQKAAIVAELSESVRSVACVGIRTRHPDYDEREVRQALVALLYGRDTALCLWPNEPLRAP